MSTTLGIDIGTSSVKTALYRLDGTLLASETRAYSTTHPRPEWAEQNPADWWQAVVQTCRVVLAEASSQPPRAVCVSGQAPSLVAVDAEGQILRPALLWLDRRSAPQAVDLAEILKGEPALKDGTNLLDSYYDGPKWMWFMRNEPHLYMRTWKLMQANGYVVYRLTGQAFTDPTHASLCTPFYDRRQAGWDGQALARAGLDLDKLPEIRSSTSIAGQVTAQAAAECGLPAGTPVLCGAGDYTCACLGAGVLKPGRAALMMGTAGNLMVPAHLPGDTRLINAIHVDGGDLVVGGMLAGGLARWFCNIVNDQPNDNFDQLEDLAASTPAGAEGLVFLPYIMGERTPIWDPLARGAFIGLSINHHRGHLYRAVLEGAALGVRQMMAILEENRNSVGSLTVIDGAARSALWRKILADVLQRPIQWRPQSGGTSLGCAFLAAAGIGDLTYADLDEWLGEMVETSPIPRHAGVYDRNFNVYDRLYPRLADCFHELATAMLDECASPIVGNQKAT